MGVSIVIPTRRSDVPLEALKTLYNQSYTDLDIIIVPDRGKGANWARNRGFKQVINEYVIFSDYDILWEPEAIEKMVLSIGESSYCYGWSIIDGKTIGRRDFDYELLKESNYIPTPCLIKSSDFVGFDEKVQRFQDWDLWLSMGKQGFYGKFIDVKIFETTLSPKGITNGGIPLKESVELIKKKHKL